jgi:hypothetical protein
VLKTREEDQQQRSISGPKWGSNPAGGPPPIRLLGGSQRVPVRGHWQAGRGPSHPLAGQWRAKRCHVNAAAIAVAQLATKNDPLYIQNAL